MNTLSFHLVYVFLGLLALKLPNVSTAPKPFGPDNAMDRMHGVLMHGDDKQGDDHVIEDQEQIKEKEEENQGIMRGPKDILDSLHGVMMHGDKEQGIEHMEQKIGPEDEPKPAGPCQGMDCMHGVMMHGDEEQGKKHKEEKAASKENESKEPIGPKEGMEMFHGVLMHGDDEAGKNHREEDDGNYTITPNAHVRSGNGVEDMEELLHAGHEGVHDENKEKVKDDKPAGIPGVFDPDSLLHADGDDAHDAHADAKLKEQEKEDYKNWQKEQGNKDNDDPKNVESQFGFLGFSFNFISDSILDDIAEMKKRYISKFWSSQENTDSKEVVDSIKQDAHRHNDMRLDLAAVGSTEPLQNLHQHGDTDKSKSKTEHDES